MCVCVCLKSSLSHPVLAASADDVGRAGHRVSLAAHEWSHARALQAAPLLLGLGQGGRLGGGGVGIAGTAAPRNREMETLVLLVRNCEPFFHSTFENQDAAGFFQSARSFSIRCSERKSPRE